jgi:hypothetical protein
VDSVIKIGDELDLIHDLQRKMRVEEQSSRDVTAATNSWVLHSLSHSISPSRPSHSIGTECITRPSAASQSTKQYLPQVHWLSLSETVLLVVMFVFQFKYVQTWFKDSLANKRMSGRV